MDKEYMKKEKRDLKEEGRRYKDRHWDVISVYLTLSRCRKISLKCIGYCMSKIIHKT
jgi:hypothetical protein